MAYIKEKKTCLHQKLKINFKTYSRILKNIISKRKKKMTILSSFLNIKMTYLKLGMILISFSILKVNQFV